MNSFAILKGEKYTYVNRIKNIITDETAVLCKDECGKFYFCSIDEWVKNRPVEINATDKTQVNKYSTPQQKIELYKSLFCGRTDVYAKRYYNTKNGKSGYVPACSNEWVNFVCDKKKYTCSKCPNRSFIEMNDRVIYNHLKGDDEFCRDVVGLYAILPDEKTKFLAIDFDEESWQNDVTAVRKICREYNIPVSVERSRSGNGAHMWFFFEEAIPASTARKFGSGLLTKAMESRHEIKLDSYDRMFPNQDTMPKGGFGNLIALPLQGRARKSKNSEFVDDNFISYPDQWEYLYNIKKITANEIEEYTKLLCDNGDLGELVSEDEKPWEKKPEQNITPMDFSGTVEIVKANMLFIKKKGISQYALNKIKRLGAFKNPDFYKSQAMRLPIYNKPRIIDTTEETDKFLCIPRGCEESLLALLDNAGAGYIIEDERNIGSAVNVKFKGELYAEQQSAVNEMLKYENGVLSATTAFGKTVVASYIIARRSVNTLILVHSAALLEQWKKSLSQFLTFEDKLPEQSTTRGSKKKISHIGLLGSGKNTLNGKVDIAIMQSLIKDNEVKEFVKDYGMVIVDECHHVSAFSFEKILKTVNGKYVYGLTATPVRQDGHHPIIFMQCGPIRYKVDAKIQAEKRAFSHYMIPRFTEFRVAENDIDYQTVCAKVCTDEMRNNMIVNDVIKAVLNKRNPIILTERKEHADLLAGLIKDKCDNVFVLSGKDKAKDKKLKLEQIKAVPKSENLVIVATGKYVGEGFDEPRLDTLFLAMPIAWKGTLAQYAGRLHRNYDGKQEVCVYDYADIFMPMLERMYHKRVKGYAELGYIVKSSDNETENIIFDTKTYFSKFSEDLYGAVKEIVISAPRLNKSVAKKIMNTVDKNIDFRIVTKTENNDIVSEILSSEEIGNCEFIMYDNVFQNFAVIDKRIVWYGNINYLSYNYSEESAMRFINESVAGKLSDKYN